jgi:hypothetical protein
MACWLWTYVRDDPTIGVLAIDFGLLVLRWSTELPGSVSLLADSSISFEDVFGVETLVPFHHAERLEFFRGFLEYYYRDQPILEHVRRRLYRFSLTGAHDGLIGHQAWEMAVRPRSRVTMAMLLTPSSKVCVKCETPFRTIKHANDIEW